MTLEIMKTGLRQVASRAKGWLGAAFAWPLVYTLSMNALEIAPCKHEDWPLIQKLCDKVIGQNYYTQAEIAELEKRSQLAGESCSYILKNPSGEVLGARVSFAPGKWNDFIEEKCHPELWQVPAEKVAYFKSLLIDDSVSGQGWGPKLSQHSLSTLKSWGTKAVVCHSWLESPNNSSQRYLLKYGFKPLKNIKNFWITKQYQCTRCGPKACVCTAVEMIYTLD